MGQKRSPQLAREVLKLSRAGMSVRDIEAELSRRAAAAGRPGTGPSKSLVAEIVRDAKRQAARGTEPADRPAPAPASAAAPPSPAGASAATPKGQADDEAAREMTAEEFAAWLATGLRDARALADAAKASGDATGQARAMRLATQLAAVMARQQARQGEEGDVVRVKSGDIDAAAERALKGLQTIADRVTAEVAAWPCCESCGRHVGDFAVGDVSPLRAMFERVARGA